MIIQNRAINAAKINAAKIDLMMSLFIENYSDDFLPFQLLWYIDVETVSTTFRYYMPTL